MTYDAHSNFGFTVVAIAPSPATTGTTFSVINANAAALPDPASVGAYNLTIYAANQQPVSSNSEIVRITAKAAADSGGTGFTQFTITRLTEQNAASSMTARSIQVGDWISNSITKKLLTDIETNKVEKSGDTMTGDLLINVASGAIGLSIGPSGAVGDYHTAKFTGGRAEVGYNGAIAAAVLIGGSGKGVSLYVNSTTQALALDSFGNANLAGSLTLANDKIINLSMTDHTSDFPNMVITSSSSTGHFSGIKHVMGTVYDRNWNGWWDNNGRVQTIAGWHDLNYADGASHHRYEIKTSNDPLSGNPSNMLTRFAINSDVADSYLSINCGVITLDSYVDGVSARTLQQMTTGRQNSFGTTGISFRILAGGALLGGSNLSGGDLIIGSGISTGNARAGIQFYVTHQGSSGSTDNNPTLSGYMANSGIGSNSMIMSIHNSTSLTGAAFSNAFVISGQNDGGFGAYRQQTANAIGKNMTIQASGANSGASTANLSGGTLILQSGISTGTAISTVIIQTPTPGSSGTTDNSFATRISIDYTGVTIVGLSGVLKASTGLLTGSATLNDLGSPTSSFSMNSQKITNLLDPTAAQDGATKNYVDSVAQGLSPKPSAIVATTTTLPTYTYVSGVITMTSTGVVAVDGHNLALNDVILIKNETSTNQPNNGLYVVTTAGAIGVACVLTRHTSMDAGTEFSGAFVFVESGTVNVSAGFVCTNTGSVTVGTTNISFTQFSGAGEIVAGTGITKSGNTLSIGQDVSTGVSPTFAGLFLNGAQVITATGSAAFAVGQTGSTNPAFVVDDGIASAVTGLRLVSKAAADGYAISVISTGSNENLSIDAKGNGTITIGGNSTGTVIIGATSLSVDTITTTDFVNISSSSSNALAVGPNGQTNPTLKVDSSTGSAATGLNIKAAAAAAGLAISVISSGTDENLTIDAKGAGTITLGGTSTGNILINRTLNLGTNNINTAGNIELDPSAARDITVGTSASGAGVALTIQAGTTLAGQSNTAGGDLILKSGGSTGSARNGLQFFVTVQGSSGTGSNSPTQAGYMAASGSGLNAIVFSIHNSLSLTGTPLSNAFIISGQNSGGIGAYRMTTSNTAGKDFTVQAGGSTLGATNKAGGNVLIQPGISTGTAYSYIRNKTYSPVDANGAPLASGTTDGQSIDRMVIGGFKALTNNSVINLVNCTLASNTIVGGIIRYTIEVFDGTNLQMETGEYMFQAANKGGVFSGNTMTAIGTPKQFLGSGTLGTAGACVWAITGANPAVISVNANSSLTPSTGYPRITYTIENYTQQAIAIQ